MNLVSDLPLYESIRRELQTRIESGELRVGDRIVPEIDLAKQLGVSRSTARKALQCLTDDGFISRTAGRGSFVLPRRPHASQPTGRVLELTLCSSDTATLGGEFARGFLGEALAAGCAAVAWPWSAQGEPWRHDASGCAVWGKGNDAAAAGYVRKALQQGTPVVVIDNEAVEGGCDHVTFEHEALARTLVQALLRKGHRAIGLVLGRDATARARGEAAKAALKAAGVDEADIHTIYGDAGSLSDVKLDLLAMLGLRDRPSALCCLDESLSQWLVGAVRELGYTPGKDVDLALACGDRPLADALLSGVLDAAAAGREAAALLLRRIESPQLPPQRAVVGYSFSGGLPS